jgi:hypothetical protein
MNDLLSQQMDAILARSVRGRVRACETQLRVAAATLRRGAPGEITATTVVCDPAAEELGVFESLVADIGDEYGVQVSIRPNSEWYAVRFTH